jgi:hypothetical protein
MLVAWTLARNSAAAQPMLHLSLSGIYRPGSKIEIIGNIGENIGNYQETLKNTKIIIFFSIF